MVQPRGRAREQTILLSVITLLDEVGYERLSIDAVAAAARASKATIYGRWPDKATLVAAALRARSEGHPTMTPGAGLRDDLIAFVALAVVLADAESLPAFVSVLLASEDEPVLSRAVRETALQGQRHHCREIARRAVARGELTDESAAGTIFDLVMGRVLVRYIVERSAFPQDDQIAFVDDVLLPVLRPDRA